VVQFIAGIRDPSTDTSIATRKRGKSLALMILQAAADLITL